MNIKYKILGIIMIIVLISIASTHFMIGKNNTYFKNYLGEQTIENSESTIHEIDREIYEKIKEAKFHGEGLIVREEIIKSNLFFDNLSNKEEYIDKIDGLWINNSEEIDYFKEEILNNRGSERLYDIKEFYKEENEFEIYPEIFTTNKYGALVSSTGITSDYRQNDEIWWKQAFENDIYVEEPSYDESSNEIGLIIAYKIYDNNGEFLGIIKELVSLNQLHKIIEESSMEFDDNNNYNIEIKLITNKGILIYQNDITNYTIKDFSNYSFFKEIIDSKDSNGFMEISEEWDPNNPDEELFLSFAKSEGYNEFKGFGWIILTEYESEEVLEPTTRLNNSILLLSLIVALILIIFGLFFSNLVSNPIKDLEKIAKQIGAGNLEIKSDIKSKDEIGSLSKTINEMTDNLKSLQKKLIESEKNKSVELESEIKIKTNELKNKLEDLNMTKSAILNIMEDMSNANENLKELDKAKSEFLNIVSHELKTPLTAMIAHLDVLDDLKGNLSEDELNSLEAIRRNSENLKDLISNILEISRIESGKFELTKSKQELDKIILDCVKRIEILSKQKGLKMITKIEDLPKVNIDDTRFKEVMNNLLTNAIKFTEEGSITIKAKKKDDMIEIKVIDTGVGIPKDKIENLFQKFYQVDASISRRYGGTGLGLSITKKIIEAHGGKISVESEGNGKGTTFTINLPIS